MTASVEIRNHLLDNVHQLIDVFEDVSGKYHLSIKAGGNFAALLLNKALLSVPNDAAILLDTRACGGIDESSAGVIINHRLGGNRVLITTESGVAKLVTMRFLNHDGSPTPGSGFSWHIQTSPSEEPLAMRPADAILRNLEIFLQELDVSPERVAPQAPRLDQLISVDTTENTVTVAVLAPIRGNYTELLQDYLQKLPLDKHVVIDLQAAGADSNSGAYGVVMAAKIRKRLGATPLQVVNIPPSLERTFSPSYSATLGFSVPRADTTGS